MLEELVNNVADEASSEVKLQLLTAVMKMFMKRPPECQDMLGRLLEHAIGQSHTHTHTLNMCIHTVTKHSFTHVPLLTKQLTSKYTILTYNDIECWHVPMMSIVHIWKMMLLLIHWALPATSIP